MGARSNQGKYYTCKSLIEIGIQTLVDDSNIFIEVLEVSKLCPTSYRSPS